MEYRQGLQPRAPHSLAIVYAPDLPHQTGHCGADGEVCLPALGGGGAARAGTDPAALTTFYRDVLGARFIAVYDPPGIIFFDFNGTRIMFESNPDAPAAIIYFWVDDIDAAHASLSEQGVSFTGTPHMIRKDDEGTFDNSGTEEWMAFFEDPAGKTLAIATPR